MTVSLASISAEVPDARIVPASINGEVDVSQLPQMLISRVDVVTGGASASWGSDAVAGVINFVTDKKFEGFKFNAQAGLSTYGDAANMLFQTAAGTSFAGGRGHFEVAGEYSYNDGLLPRYPVAQQHTAQPNIGGRTIARQSGNASFSTDAATPAGQPRSIYGALAQTTQSSAYGLITSGPYAGTTFDANGKAAQFDYAGNCFLTNGVLQGAVGSTCFGTPSDPGNQSDVHQFTQGLYDPITRGNIYARVSYDLSPSAEIYATLNYGISRTQNTPAQGNSSKNGMSSVATTPICNSRACSLSAAAGLTCLYRENPYSGKVRYSTAPDGLHRASDCGYYRCSRDFQCG